MKKNQFLFNLCNYFPHFPPFTASPLNSPYLLYFPIIPNVLYFSYFCKFSVFPNIIISPLYHIFPIILVLLIFSMFFILYTFPIFHTNLIFLFALYPWYSMSSFHILWSPFMIFTCFPTLAYVTIQDHPNSYSLLIYPFSLIPLFPPYSLISLFPYFSPTCHFAKLSSSRQFNWELRLVL